MALEDNLRHLTADGVFAAVPGIEDDLEVRPNGEASLAFLKKLAESPTPEDAIVFAAHMLAPRLAVWWGHECLRTVPETLGTADEDLLEFAAEWVADPTEENRYRAMDAASDIGDVAPGGWIAMAAGWTGGSMVPPDMEAVPPPPVLCGRAVNMALATALALAGVDGRDDRIRNFLSMAEVLAQSE